MDTHAKRSHRHVTNPVVHVTSEFGGLRKQQNNPTCTKNDSNGQLCGRWSLTEEDKESTQRSRCFEYRQCRYFAPSSLYY